ncbi:MAG: AsmA family protein [Desulfovibrio sp.]|jgi:AsmA protein|nr:AsmA family protein [Desulfovibrio sp.]
MKRVLLLGGGILVVLIVAAAIFISRIDTGFVVQKIAETTEKATGSPLVFAGPPSLSVFPPGVSFGQARWGEIKDGQGMAVSVQSGMARLELAPLFTGNLVIAEVRIDNPVFTLRENRGAKEQNAAAAPQKDATGQSGAPSGELPVELMRLAVRNGTVLYADAEGKTLNIKDINLSVENLRRREEAGVQCNFTFDMSDATAKQAANLSGSLALNAKLRYDAPKIDFHQISLTFTPLTGPLPKETGPVNLTCDGSFDMQKQQLHLAGFTLIATPARLSIAGDATLSPLAFKGHVDVEAAPDKLAPLAGQQLKPGSGAVFAFKSGMEYSGNTLHVRGMDAKLDETTLRGDLTIATGEVLSVTGSLHTGAVNVDKYLPLPEKHERKAGGAAPAKANKAPPAAKENPKSLPTINIQAKCDGVRKGKLGVNNLSFTLKGEKGKYALSSLQCALASGGDVKGSANADLPGKIYAVKTTATNVNVGALLDAAGMGRPADGTAFLDADVTLRGENAKAMMASLGGKGLVEVRGMKVAALASLPHNIPVIKGAIPNHFDLVRVPFTATGGEVAAKPVTVSSPELNAVGQARVSLPREYLDATADVKTLGMTLPVTAKGPFSNVSVGLDPKFALDAIKKAPGAVLDAGKGAAGAVKGGAKNVGDKVKGLFKK